MLDRHLIVATRPQAIKENIVIYGPYRVTVLTDKLFRVEKSMKGCFCDEATQAVWYRDSKKVEYRIEKGDSLLQIITDSVSLCLTENPENSYVIMDGEKMPLDNRANLFGTYRTLDCCNGDKWIPHDEASARILKLEDGVVSGNGIAIYDDSKSLILNSDGQLEERKEDETDIYIFAYGKDYRGAVRALYEISGSTPIIPRFAFGNWWSRYHAYTQKEYTQLMETFAKKDIPFTVATIDMDWHWSFNLDHDKNISASGKNDEHHGGNDGWTGYSWNTNLFPDHVAFLKRLHDLGLKATLNLHPALGIRYFEDRYKEMAEAMGIDPDSEQQIEFDITDDRFINAYFEKMHKSLEQEGVDFWWIDWQQGNSSKKRGLDPLWALNHYHFLDNAVGHTPLILSRYCGIGSHRYPLGFSGDTHVTWETMKYLPYFTATASNAGYGWWSHDIGGHMCGIKDDELYVRFVQFGVFSPINRLHCSNSSTFTKEPFAYKNGSGYIIEEYLRLRHRMIPFLYSASYENHFNKRTLIEPMYYEYPECTEAYEYRNQYLFGGELLVAPVVEKSKEYGMAITPVWLPEGRWTDIFTGDTYKGGRVTEMVRYMDSLPVLAKAGGVFPLDGRMHSNCCDEPTELSVMIFNGTSSYVLHEGEEGSYIHTVFNVEKSKKSQRISIKAESEGGRTFTRDIELCLKNIAGGQVQVTRDGKACDAIVDDNEELTVKLLQVSVGQSLVVDITEIVEKNADIQEKMRRELTYFQMPNNEKDRILDLLHRSSTKEPVDIIEGLDLPQVFKKRLVEVLDE